MCKNPKKKEKEEEKKERNQNSVQNNPSPVTARVFVIA